MTEEEFVLTQERIDNVEAYCASIEKDLAWHKENNISCEWLEKRVIALEHQVRDIIRSLSPMTPAAVKAQIDKSWAEARERYEIRKKEPSAYARMREFQLRKEAEADGLHKG